MNAPDAACVGCCARNRHLCVTMAMQQRVLTLCRTVKAQGKLLHAVVDERDLAVRPSAEPPRSVDKAVLVAHEAVSASITARGAER